MGTTRWPSSSTAQPKPHTSRDSTKDADEIGDARLWAGIHFRSDVDVSRRMGEQLVKIALNWDRSF
jgi:hypothetical protein